MSHYLGMLGFCPFCHLSSLIVAMLSRTDSQMVLSAIENEFPDNMMHCL